MDVRKGGRMAPVANELVAAGEAGKTELEADVGASSCDKLSWADDAEDSFCLFCEGGCICRVRLNLLYEG